METVIAIPLQEKIFKKKHRRKRQRLLISEILVEYARNSTLHGLRYVTERTLSVIEKVFWLITFIASVTVCAYLINNVYVKWRTSPVIVTVSEQLVPVCKVPYPSVTICPQLKSKTSVFHYQNEFLAMMKQKATTDDNYVRFFDVDLMCRKDDIRNDLSVSDQGKYSRGTLHRTLYTTIKEVSPKCNETLLDCIWHGTPFNCCELFKPVYTSEGLCFNFNGISADDLFRNETGKDVIKNEAKMNGWDPIAGYDNISPDPYPYRGSANRAAPDLIVELISNEADKDLLCNSANSGHKIYLHNFLDIPQSSLYYYAAIEDQVTSLAVNLNILNTSESLVYYDPKVRQCYFPNEKPLRYFKVYTAKNCQAECFTITTLHKCHCVAFYMPHDGNTTICRNREEMKCINEARNEIITGKLAEDAEDICNCLPSCYYIEYDAEVLKSEYIITPKKRECIINDMKNVSMYWRFWSIMRKPFTYKDKLKYSKMEIYFKKPLYISMRRSELFGLTDFVANIGGLLGVFLGFSFLSLVEILYFATVRIGVALKRDRDDEKIEE